MQRRTVFQDELLSRKFEENGYVVMDLFSKETIHALKNVYTSACLEFSETFYSSSFIEDMSLKKEISHRIHGLLSSAISEHFKDYKQLGGVFLVKPTGPKGEMPIHQDWTVVDESKYCSITIWIPLQKTVTQNGAIKVLPKSQKLTSALRSPTLRDALSSIKNDCEEHLIPLEMEVGQAFVFNHALLHSSYPNLSNEPRIACAYGLIHKDAEMLFYHKVDEKVEVLKISEDFFLNYPKPGERPENSEFLKSIDYQEQMVSKEEFNRFYNINPNSTSNKSIWNRVKKMLNIN